MVRLITGDECGLLKEFVPEVAHRLEAKAEAEASSTSKSEIIKPVSMDVTKINNVVGMQRIDPNESQTRSRGVVDMAMMAYGCDTSFQLAALRANGSLETWQGATNTDQTLRKSSSSKFVATYHRLGLTGNVFEEPQQNSEEPLAPPARPLALQSLGTQRRMCACNTHGNIAVLQGDEEGVPQLVHNFDAYNNNNDNAFLTYTKGKVPNTQFASAMAAHASGVVAIGGRERDVRIFDLASSYATNTTKKASPIWKAKNLPPDPQTLLQQPIWPSAMQFLNNNTNDKDVNTTHHLLAVGTAFGQLRLYDTRTNGDASIVTRRPIEYTPEDLLEHRITAVCQIDPHTIVVGDTTGDIHTLDMRYNLTGNVNYRHKQDTSTASLGRFVGPGGSIRRLVKHETLPLLAAVSYDRMLRTYNTNTRKMIDCVYLKQRLNCVLFTKEGSWERSKHRAKDVLDGHTEENENDDDDDVDQEDLVEDYVDSSSDDDDQEEDADGKGGDDDSDSDSDDRDDNNDNTNHEDQEESESGSEAIDGSEGASDEESESEEENPKKKRRR